MRLVKTVFEDEYPRYMEEDDYQWYKPVRGSYVKEAIRLMQESLMLRSSRSRREILKISLSMD